MSKTKRQTKKPSRFSEMTFVSGSGFSGCDHYDGNYDRGTFNGTSKDDRQKNADIQYTKDLEKSIMVQETTQNLPEEMGREIQKCLTRRSHYQDDINFIAPDNVEPVKEIVESDEEEWESGDETSDEEWESGDEEWNEDE